MTFNDSAAMAWKDTQSLEAVVSAVLSHAATLLREQGDKATTYAKQEQWELAAKMLEDAQ